MKLTRCPSHCLLTVLAVVLLFSSSVNGEDLQSETIWSGKSGGFAIEWTTADLSAKSAADPARQAFSLRELLAQYWATAELANKHDLETLAEEAKQTGETPVGPTPCRLEYEYRVLSIVGALLSVEERFSSSCKNDDGQPGKTTQYIAIDLNKPAPEPAMGSAILPQASLSRFWPKKTVLGAPLVSFQSESPKYDKKHPPQTIAAASRERFESHEEAFAFERLVNGQVTVRIGLPPPMGVCQRCLDEFGVSLSVPEALRGALSLAQSAQEGFLMSQSAAIAGGKATRLVFSTKY